MPIMIATRWTVSRASTGCRPHQASVLVMLVVRTARCASLIGRPLSHAPKARAAKVLGMLSTGHRFVVVGCVSRQAGSKASVAGVLD